MASSCTYYERNCGSTSSCDQNCGLQPADRQTDGQTDTHTDTWTDKSLKTEGPKILSNDIFYFRTVIIGGPIAYHGKINMCLLFDAFLQSPFYFNAGFITPNTPVIQKK